MYCHRCTTVDIHGPLQPEMRPGVREESASPAWLAATAMNACDTTKVYIRKYIYKYKE